MTLWNNPTAGRAPTQTSGNTMCHFWARQTGPGLYNVKIELTKSGARESSLNRQELLILAGATA